MPNNVVDVELSGFNRVLAQYQAVTRKLPSDVLLKQGSKLSFELSKNLKALTPSKGSITSRRLSELNSGGGIKIRKGVRDFVLKKRRGAIDVATRRTVFGKKLRGTVSSKGKRLNVQALMVAAELRLRERGREFLAFAARFPALRARLGGGDNSSATWQDRINRLLARANLSARHGDHGLVFDWGQGAAGKEAAKGLRRPRAQAAIAASLRATRDDMLVYLRRKLSEANSRTFAR